MRVAGEKSLYFLFLCRIWPFLWLKYSGIVEKFKFVCLKQFSSNIDINHENNQNHIKLALSSQNQVH